MIYSRSVRKSLVSESLLTHLYRVWKVGVILVAVLLTRLGLSHYMSDIDILVLAIAKPLHIIECVQPDMTRRASCDTIRPLAANLPRPRPS